MKRVAGAVVVLLAGLTVGVLGADAEVANPRGTTFDATAGQTFTTVVAHFESRFSDLVNFSATIAWGDGTPDSEGTITRCLSCPDFGYDVSGTHTYANAGTYSTTVAIASARDMTSGTATGTANVTGPPGPPPPQGAPLPPPGGSDLDGDRVPASRDPCPGSRRGTRVLWRGCAAIDLVHGARGLATPLLDGLAEARALLGKGRALGRPRKQIKRARGLIKRAALALAHGKPCDGSRAYSAGLRGLGSAKHGIDAAFVNARRRVARKRAPGDDVSPAQIALALLDLKRALAAGEFAHARAEGLAFSKPCRALKHRFAIRSKVVETDDAAGVVRLAGGRVLVLAEGGRWRGPLIEGSSVRVKGVGFKDGSGVATDTSPSAGGGMPDLPAPGKCLALRIAPVQGFPPFVNAGPITLHNSAAYRGADNIHRLELGMRVGVERVGCPGSSPEGKTLRYSALIEESAVGSLVPNTLATDLEDGDTPVPIGTVVAVGNEGKIKATTFVEACLQFANGKNVCDPPAELSSQEITYALGPLASKATAVYNTTSFGPQDNDLFGDYEVASVVNLQLGGSATPATAFQATGYKLENGLPTRPQTRVVNKGDAFLVYADDISDGSLFPIFDFGTERPSGLAWPHVIGVRNGKTFWYAAKLPNIVRDRIPGGICNTIPASTQAPGPPKPNGGNYPPSKPTPLPSVKDSYYRSPFPKGITMSTGPFNIDDPNPKGRHGDAQPFAFDMGAPYGTPVLAARSGIVRNLEDDDNYNDMASYDDPENDDDRPDSNVKFGNYIWVQHQDGSFVVYFHHRFHTAQVDVGDKVRRGQQLAETGSTGNAGGPHVHFEPFHIPSGKLSGKQALDVRTRFEATVGPDDNPLFNACYIPRNGDLIKSTNEPPTGD